MKKKTLLTIGQWIISIVLIIPAFSQNPNSIDLSGKWKVTWNDGNKGKNSVEDFVRFNPLLDSARYVEADVPLDLNLAMQKLGMFGDINLGTNTLISRLGQQAILAILSFFFCTERDFIQNLLAGIQSIGLQCYYLRQRCICRNT